MYTIYIVCLICVPTVSMTITILQSEGSRIKLNREYPITQIVRSMSVMTVMPIMKDLLYSLALLI